MAFTLNDVGRNIKAIRLSRNSQSRPEKPLLQFELAQKAGIPASSLCNIENGKYRNPTWEILSKIAGALECDVSDFFAPQVRQTSPSEIALRELVETIVKEKLESLLREKQIRRVAP
ncbi:MAG: helix-turn-helix domain-containing protein [Acidobacteriota bacterium]